MVFLFLEQDATVVKMEVVRLVPAMHKGAEQILICCRNEKALDFTIRRLPGVKWSKTYKCWYLPLTKQNYVSLCQKLNPVAQINNAELRKYLLKRKAVEAAEVPKSEPRVNKSSETVKPPPIPIPATPEPTVAYRLSYAN